MNHEFSNGDDDDDARTPLISLPNSTPAWVDELPEESEFFDENLTKDDDAKLKLNIIKKNISRKDITYGNLKYLGCNNLGFVNDDIRRILWQKILRIRNSQLKRNTDKLDIIHTLIPDDVYQQIQKDVARSGSHLASGYTEKQLEIFYDELTKIICWVLHLHPKMNYYQGYNDVAATVLIVMGLHRGLHVLERISLEFLERFMERTMDKVNQELFYIYALLEKVHPTLLEHLENVELFPHFALAEYTTWYAHKYAENRNLLHRLFDFFLSTPPLMPLYLSTVIVAHRATEIFNTIPDMGHTHKVLCTLPDNLPIEDLLIKAKDLYRDYPPESINKDVLHYDFKRHCKEQEWRRKVEKGKKDREKQLQVKTPQYKLPYRLKSYRTITVVTILAIGLYAFLKNGSPLN